MNEMPYVDGNNRTYSYGEFFPFEISPTAYNESLAQDFFPLNSNFANQNGYTWREPNSREYKATVNAKDLPYSIDDVDEKILKEIITCDHCQKAYRIIPIELQFYKRFSLPLPRLCHDCRFVERFKLVNPPKLWKNSCMCSENSHGHSGKCQNEFETSYDPEKSDIVYCENCYQQEII